MKSTSLTLPAITCAAIALLSCTGQKDSDLRPRAADFLVPNVDSIALKRSSDVQVFVGDSLFEYIDGGAELYHVYGFVEVATAYYQQANAEVLIDIYQFSSPTGAFGLYSMLRSEGAERLNLGVEGFRSATSAAYVKGDFVIILTGFRETEEVARAIGVSAPVFERMVPGTTAKPGEFALFPREYKVEASERIFAESFLGQAALTNVFSQTYDLDGDTLTLFLTEDQAGSKFLGWKDRTAERTSTSDAPGDMPFDADLAFQFNDSYYGGIVGGLVSGSLAGAVGFSEKHLRFVSDWVKSIPTGK